MAQHGKLGLDLFAGDRQTVIVENDALDRRSPDQDQVNFLVPSLSVSQISIFRSNSDDSLPWFESELVLARERENLDFKVFRR